MSRIDYRLSRGILFLGRKLEKFSNLSQFLARINILGKIVRKTFTRVQQNFYMCVA